MDNQKALSILIQAVQLANKAGAFELKDAKVIAEAVEFFTNPVPAEHVEPKEAPLPEPVVTPKK